ncbi:MAG: RtcB family protein [Myxococcota bacterium]
MVNTIETGAKPIKAWTDGVPMDPSAERQLYNAAQLPFIYKHIAVMPDVHAGIGATVGTVLPTERAIIPAAVGVDLGCGMMAVETSLGASELPDSLRATRVDIEAAVPHGRSHHGQRGRDQGSFRQEPGRVTRAWKKLRPRYEQVVDKHPRLGQGQDVLQLGTLGGGNHFIELCLDERDKVWVMLHSGSRGVGNRIGRYFIEMARQDMRRHRVNLPDRDLAYLEEGTTRFDDYVEAVGWAQDYARVNRELMMEAVLEALRRTLPPFTLEAQAVNCHHNYVEREAHFGREIWVTRKGAVRARVGDLGIIPGSMGAKSFIVKGKGNAEAFCSCSHGAGRVMSRSAAKKAFTVADHVEATRGVECRKDPGVIDETPMAYKDIDAVMKAQEDLVEIVHTLRQVVCVKG